MLRSRLRRRDEQGAVTLMTAGMVMMLVGMASFAVDLGQQRVARVDMQAVADLVAMDMSRELTGGTSQNIINSGNWVARVQASLDSSKQLDTVGPDLAAVACTAAQVQAVDATLSANGVCAFPGILQPDGTFADSAAAAATHVKVLARTTVDFVLPVYARRGGAARSSVARANKEACFAMGSYLASFNTGESPILGQVLGDALSTSALSYEKLASVDLSLFDLSAELGAGSPQELLDTEVTAGELFTAMATVISKQTPQSQAQIDALAVLQAAATATSPSFEIGDLLALGPNPASALGSQINALDLVKGAASLANDDPSVEGDESFLDVPGLTIVIPGIANVQASLGVVQGPRIYCGPVGGSPISSNQATVHLTYDLLGLPGIAAGVPTTVELALKLANANATLSEIVGCPSVTGLRIGVSGQTVADLDVKVTTKVQLLLNLVDVTLERSALASSTANSTVNIGPLPDKYGVKYSTGSGTLGVNTSVQRSDLNVTLAGLPIGSLLEGVLGSLMPTLSSTLSGVLSNVNTVVIPALKEQLGVTLAGVHVWATKPESASCVAPRLAQ